MTSEMFLKIISVASFSVFLACIVNYIQDAVREQEAMKYEKARRKKLADLYQPSGSTDDNAR